jgi:hypothetical protein
MHQHVPVSSRGFRLCHREFALMFQGRSSDNESDIPDADFS